MKSSKLVVFEILDQMEKGQRFTGYSLMLKAKEINGELRFPGTCLRYLREYRASQGRRIINVSKKKSLYEVG